MIVPGVYGWLNVAAVNAFVSGRIYGFGHAPQTPTYPYITWRVITSVPSQQFDAPAVDNQRVEVNVWSKAQQESLDAAAAVQTEMDKHGHQITQLGPERDSETKNYRTQLDYSIWSSR